MPRLKTLQSASSSDDENSGLKIESLHSASILDNDSELKIESLQSTPMDFEDDPSLLRITKLTPAVRTENRVNVFVNGKFSFSLDISQVVDFKLKVGQAITEDDLKKYQRASEFGKLYQRALEWVLSRPHSIKEARDYLYRRQKKRDQQNRYVREIRNRKNEDDYYGFKAHTKTKLPSRELPPILDDDIEAVLERLIKRGYLNDEKFAAYYLENRHATKGSSLRLLRRELQKRGIANDIIEAAFAASPRDDITEIKKVIKKKRNKYNDSKLIAYLVRRGFSYDLAKTAVAEHPKSE